MTNFVVSEFIMIAGNLIVRVCQRETQLPSWTIALIALATAIPMFLFAVTFFRMLRTDLDEMLQRIVFEGEPGQWRLDGRPLPGRSHGRAARANDGADTALQTHRASWAPWPGKHELSLLAPDGRVLQTVHFEVRGAAVKGSLGRPALAPRAPRPGRRIRAATDLQIRALR